MAIEHPVEEIEQQMQAAQQNSQGARTSSRWAGLLGGVALGLAALRRGGLVSAVLGLVTRGLTNEASEEVNLDIVPDPPPNPWWRRFTRRQAAIAKSEPVANRTTGVPPTLPR